MFNALNDGKAGAHFQCHARYFEEFFAVKAGVLHADIVGQPLDQPRGEIRGELHAFAVTPR
jgi:hypothetical protein